MIEGAVRGRERGREGIALAKSADTILMGLDAGREIATTIERLYSTNCQIASLDDVARVYINVQTL